MRHCQSENLYSQSRHGQGIDYVGYLPSVLQAGYYCSLPAAHMTHNSTPPCNSGADLCQLSTTRYVASKCIQGFLCLIFAP